MIIAVSLAGATAGVELSWRLWSHPHDFWVEVSGMKARRRRGSFILMVYPPSGSDIPAGMNRRRTGRRSNTFNGKVRPQQVENGGNHVVEDSARKVRARVTVPAKATTTTAMTVRARSVQRTWLGMNRPKVVSPVSPPMLGTPVPTFLPREWVCPAVEYVGRDPKDKNG